MNTIPATLRLLAASVLALGLAAVNTCGTSAYAAEAAHDHAAAPAQPLPWATDATLRDGAVKVVQALDRYGRTSDHPGWNRLHG